MNKLKNRRLATMDPDHMRLLHKEAMERLELMYTIVDASESATDKTKDSLDSIAIDHWNTYLDILHMICLHDDSMATAIKNHEIAVTDEDLSEENDRQLTPRRLLLLLLILALLRHHRRLEYVFSLTGGPMNDYFKDSLVKEREHVAHLISLIQSMV